MRQDFGKCVIERERRGSSNRSLKIKATGKFTHDVAGPDYDGPTRLPSSGNRMRAYDPAIGEKDFTDVLGPVHGFLRKSVGRRWDDVFSEVSSVLGGGSQPISHVLNTHLLAEVDSCTYYQDGKVYGQPGGRRFYGEYYVHPLTGILCREPEKSRKYVPKPTQHDTDRVHISDHRWYVKLNGIWYIGHYIEEKYIPVWSLSQYGNRFRSRASTSFPDYDRADVIYRFIKDKQASHKELRDMRRLQVKSAGSATHHH